MLVRLKLTPTNALILGVVFFAGSVLMVATEIAARTLSLYSVTFCVIGVLLLIGGLVRRSDGGDDVASDALQRRRRERFGSKR